MVQGSLMNPAGFDHHFTWISQQIIWNFHEIHLKIIKKATLFRGSDDDLMSLSAQHIMITWWLSKWLEKAQFLSQPADYGRPHLRRYGATSPWPGPPDPTQGTWIGKKKPRTMDKETKKCIALTTLLKTNQIAERSFTSINRIEVSWKTDWLHLPTAKNCRKIVCFFILLYAYAFVEALFLTGGSRSFRGVRQLGFHQVCVASSKQSSIVRKLRFRKQTFPVTQCMICSYHLHTFRVNCR